MNWLIGLILGAVTITVLVWGFITLKAGQTPAQPAGTSASLEIPGLGSLDLSNF
jgi:hypothetical protein